MQPLPLTAPFGGVNEQIPVIAIQSPNCEYMLNFNVSQAGVSLRHGDSKYAKLSAAAQGNFPLVFGKYGETKLFLATYDAGSNVIDILDVDANTTVYSTAASGTDNFEVLYFNNYLFFFSYDTYKPGIAYNGSTWGAIGYTGTGTFNPYGGDVYKSRAYLIQRGKPFYWYTEPSQISGAVTGIDLATIVSENCFLSIIAPVTISNNTSSVVLQAFVMSNGEVLFYSGSYPNSDSWALAGRARIGQPLAYSSVMQYQGDSLVFCDTGVVSLRDLFVQGSEQAANLSVNTKMQKTWQSLVQTVRKDYSTPNGPITPFISGLGRVQGNVRGVWDTKTNRIIIQFPVCEISPGISAGGNFSFVFDTLLQSWSYHQSGRPGEFEIRTALLDIIRYKNKNLTVGYDIGPSAVMVWEKEGATGFTDRNIADSAEITFDYSIISAPVSNNRAYVQKGEGVDLIAESDLYGQTNFQFIKDLGVDITQPQKLPTTVQSSLQKPNVDMGIEASYIQYKISGTTATGKTVGFELYGINFWLSQGSSPR